MTGLLMLRVRSYLELVFVSVLFELFEAIRVDRVECLDTQSKPPQLLLVCHRCAFGQEWLVVCLRQCTVELICRSRRLDAGSFLKSRDCFKDATFMGCVLKR